VPLQQTGKVRAYAQAFADAFPSLPAAGALNGLPLAYSAGVEAVLEALERAGGANGKPLLTALAELRLDTPVGRIHLDRNRQAVGSNYLSRVTREGATTLRVVPGVEQTYGGYFTPRGAAPSEISPPCVKRTPPPWAR
jgi:branched-chain amino acid transport system substrate-binding protein